MEDKIMAMILPKTEEELKLYILQLREILLELAAENAKLKEMIKNK